MLVVTSAMACVATFFLPWARSGAARRSGFALARAVDAVGLADSLGLRVLLVAFWFAPALAAAAWTAAVLGRRRLAGLAAALVGCVSATAGLVVIVSGGVVVEPGALAGIVTGFLGLGAGTTLAVIGGRGHGRRRRTAGNPDPA